MQDRWYYARDRKKHGPVDRPTLLALLRQGALAPTDMVLQEGTTRWLPLREVAPPPIPVAVPVALPLAPVPAPGAEPPRARPAGSPILTDRRLRLGVASALGVGLLVGLVLLGKALFSGSTPADGEGAPRAGTGVARDADPAVGKSGGPSGLKESRPAPPRPLPKGPRAPGLALTPLEIADRLAGLRLGAAGALSAEERGLLVHIGEQVEKTRKAGKIKVDDDLLLDVMLVASGVARAEDRRKYRARFLDVTARARETVGSAGDPHARGEKLMGFLHARVLTKGYAEDQSSLAGVLDTGQFNCVSATATYYLVGSRLGLELQPIAIPGGTNEEGHACLDLVVGPTRYQIEPTNRDGFDWPTKAKEPGFVIRGFMPDRSRGREVPGPGIASMMYFNRGVTLHKARPARDLEALHCYAAALALDPQDEAARQNLVAVFANSGPRLADEKRFAEAVELLTLGLAAAPQSKSVPNNLGLAYNRWARHLSHDGKWQAALETYRAGAKALAGHREMADLLTHNGAATVDQWAETLIREKKWDEAIKVYQTGLAYFPGQEQLVNNLKYAQSMKE